MKKTLFATIALAVAIMPVTFAAQAASKPAPATTPASTSTPVQKNSKSTASHKKSTKPVAKAAVKPATTTAAKPAATTPGK